MARKAFPTRIRNMIELGRDRGERASELTERINNSATAKNARVTYSTRQVAAAMAWHTIRERYYN